MQATPAANGVLRKMFKCVEPGERAGIRKQCTEVVHGGAYTAPAGLARECELRMWRAGEGPGCFRAGVYDVG
jgi:hypothetical protein